MLYITSMNQKIYKGFGKELVDSFLKHSTHKIIIYSEDEIVSSNDRVVIKQLKDKSLFKFQKSFKDRYRKKIHFFKYHHRMDIWAIKVFSVKQALDEYGESFDLVWLDADSKVLNQNFDKKVQSILDETRNVGIFLREDTHLHPESGFLTLKREAIYLTKKLYLSMLQKIKNDDYMNLPSWTDCSLIEDGLVSENVTFTDYCKLYKLKTSNPVLESCLRKVFRHNKGSAKDSLKNKLYASFHMLYEKKFR